MGVCVTRFELLVTQTFMTGIKEEDADLTEYDFEEPLVHRTIQTKKFIWDATLQTWWEIS